MRQPTLVTALLDIGRSQTNPQFRRKWQRYLRSLKRLCQLDLPFHIHAAPSMHSDILRWRQGRPTVLYALTADQLRQTSLYEDIRRICTSETWLSQADWLRDSPMSQMDLYVPLVNSKMQWLAHAAGQATDKNESFIWIDAGIHMHLWPGEHKLINESFFCHFIRDKERLRLIAKPYEKNTEIHGFERAALARVCGTDFVDRCCRGGLFGGTAAVIDKIAGHFYDVLDETVADGFVGTEECILTALSYRYPQQTDTTLLNDGSVVGLFTSSTPRLSLRRLRQPRGTLRGVKRRVLTHWTQWRRGAQLKTILQQAPITGLSIDDFDLHILLCARDVINGLWTLHSFLHYSDLKPRLIIHDDGSLTAAHQQRLLQHFPEARIIPFQQAKKDMSAALANYPNAYRYRITEYSWPAIKLLDFAHYSGGRAFMVLDADVLFFKRPDEIIAAMQQHKGFYMSDWQDAYTWPLERWPTVLGTTGISRVNVGLFYLPDGQLYDLGYVEQCLAAYYKRHPCPRLVWLEQTVWAALFARLGDTMQRLPDTYQISKKQTLNDNTCSHHYVNDSHLARLDFAGKGVPHLIRNKLLSARTTYQPATGEA